jgi:hypothetical protein
MGRHVAPLGHIILISSQPVFAHFLKFARLAEKQQITLFSPWFDLTGVYTQELPQSR